MKTTLLLLVFMAIGISSCGLSSSSPASYTSHFYEASAWNNDSLKAGNKTAFYYFHRAAQDYATSDDEFEEELRFEIDPVISDFTFSDSSLIQLNAQHKKSCFCGLCRDSLPIREGTMIGKKINNDKWHITAHLIKRDMIFLDTCTTLDIDRDFERRTR